MIEMLPELYQQDLQAEEEVQQEQNQEETQTEEREQNEVQEPAVRRSQRERNVPSRLKDYLVDMSGKSQYHQQAANVITEKLQVSKLYQQEYVRSLNNVLRVKEPNHLKKQYMIQNGRKQCGKNYRP